METDLYTVSAYHEKHGVHDLVLEVREVDDDYLIACTLPFSEQELTGQAADCFDALQIVRREAERQDWRICCKGSRKNVWPSAMSREMGGGVTAYLLEMGQQGRTDSLVDIFERDTPEFYSSVADQAAFADAWFESIR